MIMLQKIILLLSLVLAPFIGLGQTELTQSEKAALDQLSFCMEKAFTEVQYFMDSWYNFASKYDPESGGDFEEELMRNLSETELQTYLQQAERLEEIMEDDKLDDCIENNEADIEVIDDGFDEGRLNLYLKYLESKDKMATYSFVRLAKFADMF